MREILFRGKTFDGRWVMGDLSQHKNGKKFIKCGSAVQSYEVIPETVGQYTGLTDKNGKKIFEGDIVRMFYASGYVEVGVIRYSNDTCRFRFVVEENHIGYGFDDTDIMEVIGNVYDNPELLKGE